MYGCESWTIKKAECQRTDASELSCWQRLLRVPWTERRSKSSILKESNPEYSFEGLILKLKLQYFDHLMWTVDSLEKTLMLGKIEGRRRRGLTEDEMVGCYHWLNEHEFEQAPRDSEGQGSLACCRSWGHKESDMTEWLNSNLAPEMQKSAEEWLWMPNPQASVIRKNFIHSLYDQVILSECTINP